ncbi:hypothetical protein [Yersinia rohdei]|uniref:hypothetical protein n=1 Tax=Yersinia rohdei TaxID=29485 RepID=UPI001643D2B1|nr:hypothetical protein [Yersinia rohdei]
MNRNCNIGKLCYMVIFISFNVMSDSFHAENVCFYSGDNYTEKGDSRKFCVPIYTEDEWLFRQWNNNISSIKIPPHIRVDIFSDFSFTGQSASLYQDTNSADLRANGLIANISSYRVLPKNLYPDDKRISFKYNSNLFSEKYFGYNYYASRGHSIILTRKKTPIDIDGRSSSIFYSHSGQIMTAFSGEGFDRNIYCLHPESLRKGGRAADVGFTYCDIANPGQSWLPKKINEKFVLVNQGTETNLSLDNNGFYIDLTLVNNSANHLPGRNRQYHQPTSHMNADSIWFDEEYIENLKSSAVRPFLQYKETLEVVDELEYRDVVVQHLNEPDDINLYLGGKGYEEDIYYNAENNYLIAYNKLSDGRALTEASCLSLINIGLAPYSSVFFTYSRSSYSDYSIGYRCDNATSYHMHSHRWYFITDSDHRYLVNGHENKVLHFYLNDKPQKMNFRGVLTGPKLGERIGKVINFSERNSQDAIFINNQGLRYALDVEAGVCGLTGASSGHGTYCGALNTSWSATDAKVQSSHLHHFYIPWLLAQIVTKLQEGAGADETDAFLQKIEVLQKQVEKNSQPPTDNKILRQTKVLLIEFLHTYNLIKYTEIWHQVAYVLNRVDAFLEQDKI